MIKSKYRIIRFLFFVDSFEFLKISHICQDPIFCYRTFRQIHFLFKKIGSTIFFFCPADPASPWGGQPTISWRLLLCTERLADHPTCEGKARQSNPKSVKGDRALQAYPEMKAPHETNLTNGQHPDNSTRYGQGSTMA